MVVAVVHEVVCVVEVPVEVFVEVDVEVWDEVEDDDVVCEDEELVWVDELEPVPAGEPLICRKYTPAPAAEITTTTRTAASMAEMELRVCTFKDSALLGIKYMSVDLLHFTSTVLPLKIDPAFIID